MLIGLIIWSLILAFVWAKIEIHIEGKNAWAKELPTWKIRNKFTNIILSGAPLTGYHTWMIVFLLLAFHLPFFTNTLWSLNTELQVLGVFLFFLIVEDFLWIVINPYYGIRKFNKESINWHRKWIGNFIPTGYLIATFTGSCLLWSSTLFTKS